jgi:DNA polymerase-3 subunit epsilon
MRQIVLDTETTGLYPKNGDRIIEIGCVEVIDRRVTGNNFHFYINPERDSHPEALAIHGLTTEFLSDKPKFADIAESLREYVQDAEVVIHNAPFDLGFLNAELERLALPSFDQHVNGVIDSLVKARELHPGRRNSLDALCERYGISNSHRTLHGALLDASLLAEVYLSMTRGQNSFMIDNSDRQDNQASSLSPISYADMIVLTASEEELAEHESVLDGIDAPSTPGVESPISLRVHEQPKIRAFRSKPSRASL